MGGAWPGLARFLNPNTGTAVRFLRSCDHEKEQHDIGFNAGAGGVAMSFWDYLPSSGPEMLNVFLGGLTIGRRQTQTLKERIAARRAQMEARQREMNYFQSWRTEEEICGALGSRARAREVMRALLHEGHDFEQVGKEWRIVPWDPAKRPWRCGCVSKLETKPVTSAVPSPDVVSDKVVKQGKPATNSNPPKPEGGVTPDHGQPGSHVPPSPPPTVSNAMPANDRAEQSSGTVGNGFTSAPTSAGMADTTKQLSAATSVPSTTETTKACPVGTCQPVSNPPHDLAKPSGVAPLQVTRPQAPPSQLARSMNSSKAPSTGKYHPLNSLTAADLVGRGLVSHYKRTYVALDVVRDEKIIGQLDAEPSKFFHYFNVGLARDVEDGERKVTRYYEIEWYPVHNRYGLYVLKKDLVKVAPKITSFPKSLHLLKDGVWSLPKLPGKQGRDFAIRCRWGNIVCLPLVVHIERRKTSEPVVTVHLYAWHKDREGLKLEFCGEGYMSWRTAIVFAHCSRIGAKVALPKGGWTFAELLADVKLSSDGKEYGRGLKLSINSLPEGARQWASSFSSIFELPLSQDRAESDLDWSKGFPPVPKKKAP
jgi:hypothetical protein